MSDVDRNDALDDLNPFLGVATRTGQPVPWRSSLEPAQQSTAEGGPENAETQEPLSARALSLEELIGLRPSATSAEEDTSNRSENWSSTVNTALRIADLFRRQASQERNDDQEEQGYQYGQDTDEGIDPALDRQVVEAYARNASAPIAVGPGRVPRVRPNTHMSIVGGSGGSVSLRRGANNRPRHSILQRLNAFAGEDDNDDNGDVIMDIPGSSRATGHPPTNVSLPSDPLIVRTRGKDEDDDAVSTRLSKKSRVTPISTAQAGSSSNASDKLRPRPSYLDYTNLPVDTRLPLEFKPPDTKSRVSLTSHEIAGQKRACITFTHFPLPPGRAADKFASALRTREMIPYQCGIHYYEVDVLDAGESGYMSVGWMEEGTSLDRLVGWDKGTFGWHGDDGRSFEGQGIGEEFSETWSSEYRESG